MPCSYSKSIYHHGKRYRFTVTPKDDSRKAQATALAELNEQVRQFKEATTLEAKRQSYRKRKGG